MPSRRDWRMRWSILKGFRFSPEDIAYLSTLKGNDGSELFEKGFLDYLSELRLTCDVDAIPEGSLGLRARAHDAHPGSYCAGAVVRDRVAEYPELPDAGGHEGRAGVSGGEGGAGYRVRFAPRPRGRMAASWPAGRPIWAGAWPPRMCWRGNAWAFP